MNRSFVIVILPPIAVFIGWLWMFHHLKLALQPYQFIGAAALFAAVVLVYWLGKRKSARRAAK
jgi:hypothetical protein